MKETDGHISFHITSSADPVLNEVRFSTRDHRWFRPTALEAPGHEIFLGARWQLKYVRGRLAVVYVGQELYL